MADGYRVGTLSLPKEYAMSTNTPMPPVEPTDPQEPDTNPDTENDQPQR